MDWTSFLASALSEIWLTLLKMAPYLLLGYLIAGILSELVSTEAIRRHLGGRGIGPILKASAAGLPLPLCSCSVIPLATSLRERGAGRGATAAFVVATPMIGVDSFMLTFGLLGLPMALVRMLSSVFAGIFGGLMCDRFGRDPDPAERAEGGAPVSGGDRCCSAENGDGESDGATCCGSGEAEAEESCGCGGGGNAERDACPLPESAQTRDDWERVTRMLKYGFVRILRGLGRGFVRALEYGFVKLPATIAGPLLIGIVAAGVVGAMVNDGMITPFLGSGPATYALMLVLGLPLYVCSGVAIPFAQGFMKVGASPGAALVFLLAAPAINAATIGVLRRMLGTRTLLVLLASLVVSIVAAGLLVDSGWLPAAEWAASPVGGADGVDDCCPTTGGPCVDDFGIASTILTVVFLLVQANGALGNRLFRALRRR